MSKKVIFSIVIILLNTLTSISQSNIFYHYESSPIYLNPSLTGNFNRKVRLTTQFRNQWASLLNSNSYKTGLLSLDWKYKLESGNEFALGYYSIIDRAGELNYGIDEHKICASYTKKLTNADSIFNSIAIGISSGLSNVHINWQNANPPQSTNLPSTKWFPDINIGTSWRLNYKNKIKTQIGLTFKHLSEPNISLFENSNSNLGRILILHANIEKAFTRNFSINMNLYNVWQSNRKFEMYGIGKKYYFNKTKNTFIQISLYIKGLQNQNDPMNARLIYRTTFRINKFIFGYAYSKVNFTFGVHPKTHEFVCTYEFN